MSILKDCYKWAAAMALLMLIATFTSQMVFADGAGGTAPPAQTYIVQEGAFPWFDRVNNWALTKVPDTLKGTGPLPQQSCSSRSVQIDGSPKSVLIGVSNADVPAFEKNVPTAKATKDTISVKNNSGTEIDYTILELDNPPAKIVGTGIYGAGLILLKVN